MERLGGLIGPSGWEIQTVGAQSSPYAMAWLRYPVPMTAVPAFDAAQATWMQSGCVSVMVASRTDANRPVIGASFGCRISADRCGVTIFLGAATNSELIASMQSQRAIAVVITESATTRSIQLKASDAALVALAPGDQERVRAYVGALAQTWALAGQPIDWTQTLLDPDADEIIAVQFSPYIAFDQAPGPGAGTVLSERT